MKAEALPVLALRDTVVLPGSTVPLGVGRPQSLKALEAARERDGFVFAVAQRENTEDPTFEQLYTIGTIARVVRVSPGQGGLSVMLTGEQRGTAIQFRKRDGFAEATVVRVEEMPPLDAEDPAFIALFRELRERSLELGRRRGVPEPALREELDGVREPGVLADRVAGYLELPTADKQILLETLGIEERLRRLLIHVQQQIGVVKAQKDIQTQVQEKLGERQREVILREQLKAIKKELGDDAHEGEVDDLRQRIEGLELPDKVRKEVDRELSRLDRVGGEGMEAQVIRTYLEWVAELPWNSRTEDSYDLEAARKVLEADHYGLDDVKDRVLEFLAVRKLAAERGGEGEAAPRSKGPILLFVGPPGVGKTSIAEAIAKSLGREYVRLALGGVRDEADVRGHRRTYVGAMPGRIIQGLRQAGSKNPVILLDEVDKLGMSHQGDPSSALLEVLDPAQNHTFTDHYLNVPFDLSEALFIATANFPQNIPAPLMDRMELVEFSGYTEQEKVAIAERYLWPKKLEETGLAGRGVKVSTEGLRTIVSEFTRESGVRQLAREIERVTRKVAHTVATGDGLPEEIDGAKVKQLLGRPRVRPERAAAEDSVGMATGMYYTPAGGDIMFVEASVRPTGTPIAPDGERSQSPASLVLTGQLGDVMKESARAALTYALHFATHSRSMYSAAPVEVHVHVPAGAIPKDGPSAGIAMTTSLISALTGREVRGNVAMTGEITLRGRVLPIGGVKEKVLGAHRAGITDIILPKDNAPDLEDVPEQTRQALRFHFAETIDDVLHVALTADEQEQEVHVH